MENILIVIEIDKNDNFEKQADIVKEFLKNINRYKEIAKINDKYLIGKTPIRTGQFIADNYNKDKFELQYTGETNEEL